MAKALLQALEKALGDLPPPCTRAEDIPASPGSYLLLIHLPARLLLRGRFAGVALAAGWHVYAGSARGPGGLRARLKRHLTRQKRPRWHVDQLTTAAAALLALPFSDVEAIPAPTECMLTQTLLASGLFTTPVPGFGSSDCRSCPAHLLRWND